MRACAGLRERELTDGRKAGPDYRRRISERPASLTAIIEGLHLKTFALAVPSRWRSSRGIARPEKPRNFLTVLTRCLLFWGASPSHAEARSSADWLGAEFTG